MIRALQTIAIIVVAWVITAVAVQHGRNLEKATNPVCHAKSEDSVITDCDYRNGAWYRK